MFEKVVGVVDLSLSLGVSGLKTGTCSVFWAVECFACYLCTHFQNGVRRLPGGMRVVTFGSSGRRRGVGENARGKGAKTHSLRI